MAFPRSRNPRLAEAIKRIGLAERTGRGVDRIYEGVLRYGRPAPDYSGSSADGVVLHFPKTDADLPFIDFLIEEENRTDSRMPVETLIVLSQLREAARLDVVTLSHAMQKDETHTRAILDRMVEAGTVQPYGSSRRREYSLSPAVYRRLGKPGEFVRQAGFDDIQQEQMVLRYIKEHGRIARRDVRDLCRLDSRQAERLLRRLSRQGEIRLQGEKRGAYYVAS